MSTDYAPGRDAQSAPDRELSIRWWTNLVHEKPGFELLPHAYWLLAEGQPVKLDQLAAAVGQPVQEVEAKLRAHSGVDWDEQGRLVGANLTLRPTATKLTLDGRTFYGFCASSAFEIAIVLGKSAVVESACPGTGVPIRVEVTPERVVSADPATAVVTSVRSGAIDDVRAEVCELGHFVASREAAAGWLAAHPQGMVHTVAEEFGLMRQAVEAVGWVASGPRRDTPH